MFDFFRVVGRRRRKWVAILRSMFALYEPRDLRKCDYTQPMGVYLFEFNCKNMVWETLTPALSESRVLLHCSFLIFKIYNIEKYYVIYNEKSEVC